MEFLVVSVPGVTTGIWWPEAWSGRYSMVWRRVLRENGLCPDTSSSPIENPWRCLFLQLGDGPREGNILSGIRLQFPVN